MTTKICPICKQPRDTLRSAVRDGEYVSERCDKCHASFAGFADNARKFERDWQGREFARDLIQPQDPEFPKAFGGQAAHDRGWSDEAIRRLT